MPLTNNHSQPITTSDSSVARKTRNGTSNGARLNHRNLVPFLFDPGIRTERENSAGRGLAGYESRWMNISRTAKKTLVVDSIRFDSIRFESSRVESSRVRRASNNARNYGAAGNSVAVRSPRRLSTMPGKCTVSFANIVPLLCLRWPVCVRACTGLATDRSRLLYPERQWGVVEEEAVHAPPAKGTGVNMDLCRTFFFFLVTRVLLLSPEGDGDSMEVLLETDERLNGERVVLIFRWGGSWIWFG